MLGRLPAPVAGALSKAPIHPSMRWFRSNMHFGAGLALIALMLQLVLTFGHVHAPPAVSNGLVLLSKVFVPGGSGSGDPADKGLADSDCPTCALIQLAATSTPAPTLFFAAACDIAKCSFLSAIDIPSISCILI